MLVKGLTELIPWYQVSKGARSAERRVAVIPQTTVLYPDAASIQNLQVVDLCPPPGGTRCRKVLSSQ